MPTRCVSGANVASVESHGDRGFRWRNIVNGPFLSAWLGIQLGEQIRLAALADPVGVTTNAIGIDLAVERQHILE